MAERKTRLFNKREEELFTGQGDPKRENTYKSWQDEIKPQGHNESVHVEGNVRKVKDRGVY